MTENLRTEMYLSLGSFDYFGWCTIFPYILLDKGVGVTIATGAESR